jgi:hypothetical protein
MPLGGDIADCLSSVDIDHMCRPLLGAHWLDARGLYDVRTGRSGATAYGRLLERKTSHLGWVATSAHVRHHWVTAIFVRGATGISATVVDSAPSCATRADIMRLMRRVGISDAQIRCCGMQTRGSNECGLHVVRTSAALRSSVGKREPVIPTAAAGTVSLAAWRRTMAALPPHPSAEQVHAAIAAAAAPEREPEGGALKRPACSTCAAPLDDEGDCTAAACPRPTKGHRVTATCRAAT